MMKPFQPLLPALIAVTVFLSAPRSSWAALPDKEASANNALASGRAAEALNSYRTILDASGFARSSSPELWYNRGLAEEKNGDSPAAVLSFRRALLLDPTLASARTALVGALETLDGQPPSTTTGWREQILERIHPESMIVGGSILGWIGVLILVMALFVKPRSAPLIFLALTGCVLGHGLTILGSMIDPRRIAASEAVVIAKSAPLLRATPVDSASASGTLPPGSLITVLSRNGMWWYVADGSGQTGWIPANTATPLLPGSASL